MLSAGTHNDPMAGTNPTYLEPDVPVSRATFWATVILARSLLTRCEIGAAEPTQGHAVDTARAGEDGVSAVRNDTPRHVTTSAAMVTIGDLRTVEHKRELDRMLITRSTRREARWVAQGAAGTEAG
jgi:hypothetical protein